MGWDPNIWHITVHYKNAQQVSCFVTFIKKHVHFFVTFVYAFNTPPHRVSLWEDLLSLSGTFTMPWIVTGDFNCVSSLTEISGGRKNWSTGMQNFKDCIVNSGLGHISTVRPLFTWTNKRPMDPIFR